MRIITLLTKLIYSEIIYVLLGWKYIYYIILKDIEKHTVKTNEETLRLRGEIERL